MLILSKNTPAKTFDVDVSTGRPAAANEAYYHGETIEFRAVRGRTVVTNIEYACIYYQTNGMDQAWWKTDGLVFHPTNDVGAASYRFFLEGRERETGNGEWRDWHANGLLRLLPSPGFTPNEIELPVSRLDFAGIEVANAPYYTKAETDERIVALAPAPGNYAAVSNAAMNAAAATNDFLRTSGGTMRGDLRFRYFDDVGVAIGSYHPGALVFSSNYPEFEGGTAFLDLTRIPTDDSGYGSSDIAFLSDIDEALADIDLSDYATTGDLAALAAEVAPAVAAYPRVYSFMTGATNANFVVTNYQLTAEADAGRTHFDPADPDLDFSTVPSSLRLEDFSSGTNRVVCDTRDWTVWYFAQKIGGAINTAFTNAVATCRAWCGFTATGLENPVPDTLIVDVPNIWLMAGKTFEKHVAGTNSCWVIRSKDTVVPISDNSQSAGGFLELTDAFGEPYIRFNKSESYFIDPRADGIEYDAATGAWCVSYPTQNKPKGGANAVLEGSATYPGKAILKDEDDPDCPATITWTGSAGAWVMNAVPKAVGGVVPSQMFFAAVIEVEGQDYIEYLRPMSIPHLLVDGVKIAPVVPATHPAGTTVTWKVVE